MRLIRFLGVKHRAMLSSSRAKKTRGLMGAVGILGAGKALNELGDISDALSGDE